MSRIILYVIINLIFIIPAYADLECFEIEIKDNKFHPEELIIPANKKVKLLVRNNDKTIEEFESLDLRREKIIPAGSKVKITIGPLKPGEYKFFGEFHPKTAQGKIIVK